MYILWAKITISEISFNTQGIFFRYVAYSRYDAPTEMFQTTSSMLYIVIEIYEYSIYSTM
jgi:hypothetical protein